MRPCVEVDEEELARLEAALAHDVLRRLVEHAGLRGEHDPAVLRLEPAPGTQAVAVERRADHAPVGERDRGRPVPRLHQALVVRVEAAQLVGQVVAALVRLRDHHHHRVRQRPAREHEQLEHVVELRRCRSRRGGRPGAPCARSSPNSSDASCDSRARIQLTLPRSVLISPLCAISRYGCASSQLGNVFVEKREWTSASALSMRSSTRSGK